MNGSKNNKPLGYSESCCTVCHLYILPIFCHKVLGHSYTMSSLPSAPLKRRRSLSPDINSNETKMPQPEKKKMKLMTSVQRRCRLAQLLQKQKQKQQMIAVACKTSLDFSAIIAKLYLAKVSSAYVVAVPVAGSKFFIVEGPQSKSFLPIKCPNSHSPDH